MNAREFLTKYGAAEAERIAVDAGTNLAYFKQLAYRARRPSVDLAQQLVSASNGRLDFMALVSTPKPVASAQGAAA